VFSAAPTGSTAGFFADQNICPYRQQKLSALFDRDQPEDFLQTDENKKI
jgi:hypothetical protein